MAPRKSPPLKGERRTRATPAKKTKRKPAAKGKVSARRTPAKRKPAKRKKRAVKRGFLSRLFRWIFRKIFRLIWWVGIRTSIIGGVILAGWVGFYFVQLPPMEAQLDGRARGSVQLMDRYGEIFAWRGEQFDGSLRSELISPHLRNAVIATEDKRFFSHFGISPRGVASAVRINLREGRGPLSGHGGSTITQQVAKLLCLGVPYEISSGMSMAEYEADCRRGSLVRKVREAVYALALEARYSKDEILTIYLNRAFLGAGAYGFEAAAHRYFNISARDLIPAEAAMLAGLLTAPSRFAPTNNLERSQNRAALVIGLMLDQGFLTEIEASIALANPATLTSSARDLSGEDFADWIMAMDGDTMMQTFTRDTVEDVQILTTFDPAIQAAAEAALADIFENRIREGSGAQAAIVVLSADGAVRAIVGGRDIVGDYFNRATQAQRQTGSSFKPFVYATALEAGFSPNNIVEDAPLSISMPGGQSDYRPANYSRQYLGLMTMSQAMSRSINTVAVRISEEVGRERVRAMAMDFGIRSEIATGPSLALGVSEANLLEMTGAYAGFLNGGRLTRPFGMLDLRLADGSHPLPIASRTNGRVILNQRAAGYLVYMLNQVVETGSGRGARMDGWQIGGKTGTTQGAKDAWFIGFTADYVTGVWMGYDDNTPLTGVTGSGLPTDIWHEVMVRIHEGRTPRPLPMIIPPEPRPIEQIDTPMEQERQTQTILQRLFNGPSN
ncbi:MAG: transglycosylase domain-containing protein [Rhodobacteraceae bacterium]|nr:transglycosylase domain-containing protein [Paracoccaceae bacterium]